MDGFTKEHEKAYQLSQKATTLAATQDVIDQLRKAREAVLNDPTSAQIILTKLQAPVKGSFDTMIGSLKTTRGAHNGMQKALDKLFRDKPPLPSTEIDALSSPTSHALVNRAIHLHLLREGLFDVASSFQEEADKRASLQAARSQRDGEAMRIENSRHEQQLPENIIEQFQTMHHILRELKVNRNLSPAMEWAATNAEELQSRGSNLSFELCRLQYVRLLLERQENGSLSFDSLMQAVQYARTAFQPFEAYYSHEIQELMGAMAYASNIVDSPYYNRLSTSSAWDDVALSFTREFCALLELSAESPLYLATTAGAIALPPILKLQEIQKNKNAEWTTQNELGVETPLPPTFQYHSVFVCPVSKEMATDDNPAMIMPCGHAVLQESLLRLAKGTRFKCYYCSVESSPKDATRIIL